MNEGHDDAACATLHDAALSGSVAAVAAMLARGDDVNAVNDDGVTPLLAACSKAGNTEIVECLLGAGAKVDVEDEWGMTALHAAADQGDVRTMAVLVNHGADVHALTTDGRSALYLSALRGSTDAVAYLLHQGVAVGTVDDVGLSALHAAARKGNVSTMALLIEHGADPHARTEDGRSAVYLSALYGKSDAVQFLLGHGVPANAADNYGWTALHAAAESGDVRTLSILVQHHANVHARTSDERSTLFLSALDGEFEAVNFLIECGVAVNTRDENGWSAIHAAAESGVVPTLALLVEHGANAHAETALGRSALFIAALNGNVQAVKYLLDLGLPVDATDDDGWTVLHAAADSGDVQTINLLVSYGADVEALTTDGRSTLYVSAVNGNTDAVKYFLDHGVIVDADDDDVVESLRFAAGRGDVRTMALLAEHGADLYAQTTDGRSTLFAGALDGEHEAVKFLLERGAAVDAKDENGWSSFLLAAQSGDIQTLRLLVEAGADIHAQTPDGRSAVAISAWHQHLDAVTYLLDTGVAHDSSDEIGWTALHAAARKGNTDIIKALVEHGADVLSCAKDGRTPLFLSALSGKPEAVRFFVEKNVPIDARDDKGWTAFHAATRKGSVPSMKILVEHGADVHAVTEVNSNVLHISAYYGRVDALHYALELGVTINAIAQVDDVPETPLTLAIQEDDHDIAYRITLVLCSHGAEWRDDYSERFLYDDEDEEGEGARETDWRRVRQRWRAGLCACARHWAEEYLDTGYAETKIPSEVIARGQASVSTYLADMMRSQGQELIHRCKICVVGPSEWGKTSLVRSLESNQSILTQQKDRTIGIELVPCVFDHNETSGTRERQEVTFWDFAGQDVYQVAHSLFFSRRTLYVLVVDLEAYGNQLRLARSKPDTICESMMDRFLRSNIFRWVRRILAHQPDARFTVVGTKADRLFDTTIIQDVWRDLEDRLKAWKAASASREEGSSERSTRSIGDDPRAFKRDDSDEVLPSSEETHQQRLDLSSGGWLVVNPNKLETIAMARGALQQAITLNELGFPMWKTYAKVQRAVSSRRETARRQTDGSSRIEHSIIRFRTLRNQLVDEFEALEADECEQILRTLNDLGDVLWYEHEGAGVLKDFIILDPMLVIDIVREVIRHDFSSNARGEWPRDGRISHDLLCTFPMWKDMDKELMHAFKSLLQHFQLAYPADDDMMHPESDLIVPTYWQVARSASSRSLVSRKSVCDTFGELRWCWEYDLSSELAETIFEQFAVQSHSAHMKRTIRGACIEAKCEEFASSITLVPQTAMHDTIRIEVGGTTVDSSWHTMRFYLMKMEKVLEHYSGAVVGRYVVYRPSGEEEQRKPLHCLVRALEDAISLGKDEQSVRVMMPWMPPDLLWYLQRAWNSIASFQQLQMTRYIHEKLEVVRKLAIAGSAPRFPALWSLEHIQNENKVVLRVSSDLSGRCFHVPMEIDTGSPALAKYGSILKEGLSIFSTVAADALSFPIVQTVIEAATSGIGGQIDHAQRVHNLIERLNLPTTNSTGQAVFDSRASKLAPGVATKVLRDLLAVYNDSSDELEISEITNLECAVTSSGEYVWAHAHEIAMLGNEITRCAAPPSTWALFDDEPAQSPKSVASFGGTPRSPVQKRSSTNSSKLKLSLCVESVDGLADWDWYKVYCKWQLLYGDTMSAPIAGGATTQHGDGASPPGWGNVSTAIKSVASWEMLRECRLAVQVKRRSRIGWTKFIGEGSVLLSDVIDEDAERTLSLDAVRVPLDSGASKRFVTIQLSVEAP